jgi:hypothetical protein
MAHYERVGTNTTGHAEAVQVTAEEMSGFGSRRSVRFWGSSKPGDRDATRGPDGAVCGGIGAVSGWAVELPGTSGVAGNQRAAMLPIRGGGAEGLIDRRRGRASGRRAAVGRIEFVIEQYRTRYWDFTVKHFHETLWAEHGICFELYLNQGNVAEPRAGGDRAAPFGPPQEAAAPALARHDARRTSGSHMAADQPKGLSQLSLSPCFIWWSQPGSNR